MPSLALPVTSRVARLSLAEARWQAVLRAKPELEPAVRLQRHLIGEVIELAETLGTGRLPRLSLPQKYLAAKIRRGVPMLAGEPVPLPVRVLTATLSRLCTDLAAGGAGEPATHIKDALDSGTLDAGSLLTASLMRDQHAIRTGAVQRCLAADLVWLVAELAVCPFAYLVIQGALSQPSDAALSEALANWGHGYCPACGSWPALAEVTSDARALRCSFCAFAWEVPRYACIYCGEAGAPFVTAAPDESRKDRRLELCETCHSYFKATDVASLSPFPLLAIADLETMDLDLAAMQRGYGRPPLKSQAGKPVSGHC